MAHLIHNVLPIPPRKIVFIHPQDSVNKCIDIMVAHDIGALVVVDNQNQLVGIVSERDVVRRCLQKQCALDTTKVNDVVFTEVTILSPHDPIEKAMQAMTKTKRRHILIREDSQFIAILSIGDLLFHLLDDKAREIEHLENYIHHEGVTPKD
jgi:CBS domain-containing protein